MPVDRLRRQPRRRAHLRAEGMQCRERRLARPVRPADDVAHVEQTLTKAHADPAAPHIGPETHALGIDLPEAERGRTGAHAVRVSDGAIGGRDIPGHDAVGRPAAPLEITVAALPRVAEDEANVGEFTTPPQVQSFDRGCRRRQ